MVWPLVRHETQAHFSQSFLASGMDKFSLPVHVKVLDEEADEDGDDLADGVPFNSLS